MPCARAATRFATNTSSFYVRDVAAAGHRRPDRVVGMHFFYHPAKNRLGGSHPGPETESRDDGAGRGRSQPPIGKTPIASAGRTGFRGQPLLRAVDQ
jgi:hypothetical protein